MKKTKVDALGRVLIPKPIRNKLNLKSESEVVITLENNSVVIRPEKTVCKRCGAFVKCNHDFPLCENCVEIIKKAYT